MNKSLFQGLTTTEISNLREILTLRQETYPAKNIIPFSDLKSNTIGIINTGLVELISRDSDGRDIVLSYFIKEDSFGPFAGDLFEMITEEDPYEGNYLLVRKSADITFLNYEELLTDRPKYQEICKKIIQNLIRIRLMDNRARILILSRRSIRERFMTFLEILWSDKEQNDPKRLLQGSTFLSAEASPSAAQPILVALPFSYTDLAGYLIVDRSALMREIRNMKDEGLIAEEDQKLRLLWKED